MLGCCFLATAKKSKPSVVKLTAHFLALFLAKLTGTIRASVEQLVDECQQASFAKKIS
jgi:hypothetical protein